MGTAASTQVLTDFDSWWDSDVRDTEALSHEWIAREAWLAAADQGWTYVEDGLPEAGVSILVATPDRSDKGGAPVMWIGMLLAEEDRPRRGHQFSAWDGEPLVDAYAWRPLPVPPPVREMER